MHRKHKNHIFQITLCMAMELQCHKDAEIRCGTHHSTALLLRNGHSAPHKDLSILLAPVLASSRDNRAMGCPLTKELLTNCIHSEEVWRGIQEHSPWGRESSMYLAPPSYYKFWEQHLQAQHCKNSNQDCVVENTQVSIWEPKPWN